MIPASLFKKIRRIEIRTRGLVEDVFGGEYHSAFRGRGIEFSEVRPYQIGDEVRWIDWNVSARMGEAYVKIFEEEREQTILLAVDISGSGSFGTNGVLKREVAAEISALLALSAVRNNDRVGLILFSDHVERFVPPKKGKQHALRLVRDIFVHEAESKGTQITSVLNHIIRTQRRRAIVVLISDFMDEGFERTLRAVATRHDVVAIRVEDPREVDLPNVGLLALNDAETGEYRVIDTGSKSVREAFSAEARERSQTIRARLAASGVDSVTISTDTDFAEPLARFFRLRIRKGARNKMVTV